MEDSVFGVERGFYVAVEDEEHRLASIEIIADSDGNVHANFHLPKRELVIQAHDLLWLALMAVHEEMRRPEYRELVKERRTELRLRHIARGGEDKPPSPADDMADTPF